MKEELLTKFCGKELIRFAISLENIVISKSYVNIFIK
jgi:hypothetical protein